MKEFRLRNATLRDAQQLFDWRNDTTCLSQCFSTTPLVWDNHVKWLNKVLESEHRLLFILTDGDIDYGQFNVSLEGDVASIGYSIDIDYRNQGYGSMMLDMMINKIFNEYPEIAIIEAEVKLTNEASNKLLQSKGFKVYELYDLLDENLEYTGISKITYRLRREEWQQGY